MPSGGIKLPVSAFGNYRTATVRQKIFQGWEWLADNHSSPVYKELRSRHTIFMRAGGIYIQPTLSVKFEELHAQNGSVDIVDNLRALNEWLEEETPGKLTLAVNNSGTTELESSVAGLTNIKVVKDPGYISFIRS